MISGPTPKDASRRRRRNQPTFWTTVISASARGAAPPLPDGFSEETRAWYRTWAESAQGSVFVRTDWLRLLMLAHLVEAFHEAESARARVELAAELRANEGKLGATLADRRRLRWRIVDAGGRDVDGAAFDAGTAAIDTRAPGGEAA